jgi:hypothetical protein
MGSRENAAFPNDTGFRADGQRLCGNNQYASSVGRAASRIAPGDLDFLDFHGICFATGSDRLPGIAKSPREPDRRATTPTLGPAAFRRRGVSLNRNMR